MRILPLGPCTDLPVGHDPCEGCAEMSGGTLCEFCLWRRRWRSLGGTIRGNGVPKRAGGRYAITTLSFPFLGSSLLPWPTSSLIPPSACILASPSFLFPLCASLLPPIFPERDPMVLVTPSPGFLVSFIGLPVPGFSEFFGFVRFVRFLDCLALHCVALRCITVCIALSFTLHWSTIALHCFDLCCIALPGTRFAQCCLRCFTSHRHRMLFPWQCVAMHCHCIVCVPFTALHCFAFNCTYVSLSVRRLCSNRSLAILSTPVQAICWRCFCAGVSFSMPWGLLEPKRARSARVVLVLISCPSLRFNPGSIHPGVQRQDPNK